MLIAESSASVADNSGAKEVKVIKVLGGSKKKFAQIGDIVKVSVKKALSKGRVTKGKVCKAVVVRTKKGIRRKDGSLLKFDRASVVLLNEQNQPIGTRIFGPVPRELRDNKNGNFAKIISLAPQVL